MVYDGHFTQPTIEGTKLYKRDGYYYIFSPAGGVATGWQTVLRAKEIFGPYEEKIVMAWAPGTINGPHQGAWVEAPDGTNWFLHFQDKGAYGRIVHLQPMTWTADGWPVIGEDPDGDGVGQKWPYRSLWDCPNVLLQKFQAESFTVTARLTFRPNPDFAHRNETAGFVVMGNDYAGLRITDGQDGAKWGFFCNRFAPKNDSGSLDVELL